MPSLSEGCERVCDAQAGCCDSKHNLAGPNSKHNLAAAANLYFESQVRSGYVMSRYGKDSRQTGHAADACTLLPRWVRLAPNVRSQSGSNWAARNGGTENAIADNGRARWPALGSPRGACRLAIDEAEISDTTMTGTATSGSGKPTLTNLKATAARLAWLVAYRSLFSEGLDMSFIL